MPDAVELERLCKADLLYNMPACFAIYVWDLSAVCQGPKAEWSTSTCWLSSAPLSSMRRRRAKEFAFIVFKAEKDMHEILSVPKNFKIRSREGHGGEDHASNGAD